MMKIINYIKRKIAESRAEAEKKRKEEKDRIINRLTTPMTEKEVDAANNSLIINSAGWIGGDYSEKEIKMRILIEHQSKFSDKEISDLKKKIK